MCVSLDLSSLLIVAPQIDVLGCKCYISSSTFYIFVIYIPPATSVETFESFFEVLENYIHCYKNHVIFVGDFNITEYATGDLIDKKTRIINNFVEFFDLAQLNYVLNSNNRLLDLVLSNLKCEVTYHSDPFVLEDSHHPALSIYFNVNVKNQNNFTSTSCIKKYNFKKANYPALYSELTDVDWSFLDNYTNVNTMCETFYEKLYSIFDLHVPLIKQYKRKYPVWYTKEIIKNIKSKSYLFKKIQMHKITVSFGSI